MCKKHNILGTHMTCSSPISEKEEYLCAINMIEHSVELVAKSHRGEILTMDPDTEEMYFPKDRPGFVPK
jgi:hypothetical protein